MHVKEDRFELTEELSLGSLVADIAQRCVSARAERLDSVLEDCQRRFCQSIGVDHSELWQAYEGEEGALLLTHLHDRRAVPAANSDLCERLLSHRSSILERADLPLRTDAKAFFPWIFRRARRGETVVISSIDELPAEAARDGEMLLREQMQSVVAVPLSCGERWLGLIAFGASGGTTEWSGEVVKAFEVVGNLFAQAIFRLRTEHALVESELKLNLATAKTKAEFWELQRATGELKFGEKNRLLLGMAPGDACPSDRLLTLIHPDDRAAVRTAWQEAFEQDVHPHVDYRITAADGQTRWISSDWHPMATARGSVTHLLGVAVEVTEHRNAEEELRRIGAENRQLKERIKSDGDYTRGEIKLNQRHTTIVGQSRIIRKVLQQVEQVAPVSCPVLITGESGTGKELIAQSIHRFSQRANRAMVTVNCAALPAGLIESELFGRERGAFTGALSSQAGRFEMADQSTIFLDEVAELPLELQGKLLRVLQEGEYARLGNPKTRKVDARVIAATNRDLPEEVRKGRFREDLFYRLSVFPINLPPLRDRADDIPLLVFAFMEELSTKMGKRITKVPQRMMEALARHYWPGNIRELRNVIERGVILSSGDTLRVALTSTPPPTHQAVTLAEVERQHILATLEKTDWHIKGPHGAAKILDLKPGTLYSRMRKLGVPHRRQKDGIAAQKDEIPT